MFKPKDGRQLQPEMWSKVVSLRLQLQINNPADKCVIRTQHISLFFFFVLLLCTKKGKTRNQLAKIYMYIYIFFLIINDREIVQPSVKFHPSVAGK